MDSGVRCVQDVTVVGAGSAFIVFIGFLTCFCLDITRNLWFVLNCGLK